MAKTTGLASMAEGRQDVHKIDPRKLKIEPGWNSREPSPELDAHIDMLAQSIAQVGVRTPLKAIFRDGEAFIRSGHCRLAASLRAIEVYGAELKTVPVMAEDRYATDADQVLGQIIDNEGKPLTAFEKAKVYKRLMDLGWDQTSIAAKSGVSQSHVSQVLDMLLLPNNIREMVARGEVSATLAIQTFKACNEDGEEAYKQLKEAVTAAKSEGRQRAKPSDMGEKRDSLKKRLRNAFEGADIQDAGDIVTIRINREDWEDIRADCGHKE